MFSDRNNKLLLIFIGYVFFVFITISCIRQKDTYPQNAKFSFSFGTIAGSLTLFGDSIRKNGDYVLIVQKFNRNDTIVGSYQIELKKNRLIGVARSGFEGVLFSTTPTLDSGYLFDEPMLSLSQNR